MEETWQQALAKMANGVYILTTCHENEINGMIISWVTQISYDPPLIMVAIHPNRYSHRLVEQSGRFALNILAQHQSELIRQFMGPAPSAKFESIPWTSGITGCPILPHSIAAIECEVIQSQSPGNHTLFFGQIKDVKVFSNDDPMSTFDYSGTYLGKD